MKMLSSVVTGLLNLLGRLIGPLAFFIAGRKSKELEDVKEESEVLRKQRDNNVYSLDDAHRLLEDINDDL